MVRGDWFLLVYSSSVGRKKWVEVLGRVGSWLVALQNEPDMELDYKTSGLLPPL